MLPCKLAQDAYPAHFTPFGPGGSAAAEACRCLSKTAAQVLASRFLAIVKLIAASVLRTDILAVKSYTHRGPQIAVYRFLQSASIRITDVSQEVAIHCLLPSICHSPSGTVRKLGPYISACCLQTWALRCIQKASESSSRSPCMPLLTSCSLMLLTSTLPRRKGALQALSGSLPASWLRGVCRSLLQS